MATPPESTIAPPSVEGDIRLTHRRDGEPPLITPTDGELLRLFARQAACSADVDQGDAVFRQLIDRHGPMVWRVCRQILPGRQDAEDAFQATFLILARRARSVRASESAAGWLYRVAFRTAMSAKRRNRRRKEARLEHEPLAPAEAAFPDLAGRETAAALMEELGKMPAKYRTPLVLRYLEGRTRREIAEQTDATIPTVQGQLARGKALLRSRLVRRGVSLSAAMTVVSGTAASAANESRPSSHVITQTSSNATAVATGSSVAASVAVVSLYREGVRAMIISQIAKPLSAAAMATLVAALLVAPSWGEGETSSPAQLTLDAEPPVASVSSDSDPPELLVEVAPAGVESNEPIYPVTYYAADLLAAGEVEPALEDLAQRLKQAVPGEWAPAGEWEVRVYPNNISLVVAAPQNVHEQLADELERLRANNLQTAKSAEVYRLAPGEVVLIGVSGGPMIDGEYRVERSGTIPLGAGFGRVKVAGMTILEAEAAVRRQLETMFEEVAVQITEPLVAQPAGQAVARETPTRPTPRNGTVVEYWPSGEVKGEYSYRNGQLEVAAEYSETGQVLYEFADKGPERDPDTKSNEETEEDSTVPATLDEALEEIEWLIREAEAHYDAADQLTAEATEFSRSRQSVQILFSNQGSDRRRKAEQLAREWLQVALDDAENPAALIRQLETRAAKIDPLFAKIEALKPRQQRSMDLWNAKCHEWSESQSAEAELSEPATEATVSPPEPQPPEPEDDLDQLARLVDRSEAHMKIAERLLQTQSVEQTIGTMLTAAIENSHGFLDAVEQNLKTWANEVVEGMSFGEDAEDLPANFDSQFARVEQLGERIASIRQRSREVSRRWHQRLEQQAQERAAD